ncbi:MULTISPECIES: SMI1/KNR4 family protein [unclassified Ruegeria]|uniref:SMI1/KNR4 family protein n=1 Tax=unclassified Ruegeria TaxID=2625375 RepID=UPI0014896AF0|nr:MULTISPECIES: SMI1/KNR4 family protein [unclassified Ruegeria]
MTKEPNISEALAHLTAAIRGRWDKLGFFEGEHGSFATGHTPTVAPQAYLCRFYAGLIGDQLAQAEEESDRHLPTQYADFLREYNGASIMGITLFGATGGQYARALDDVIGQPISLRYQNAYYLRPDYVPEGHFGIGSMNGEWYSQGQLYLTSAGEVELINKDHDLIGARWSSMAEFLKQEVSRQMKRYDDAGNEITSVKRLPGETSNWEQLAKEVHDKSDTTGGLFGRFRRFLHRS